MLERSRTLYLIFSIIISSSSTPAHAQDSPCDPTAASRALDGSTGYQTRVSKRNAQANEHQGKPLTDPYCDGFSRAPVSGLVALRFTVQSAQLYARKFDPRDGKMWTIIWPFISPENHEDILPGSKTRIRGRSIDNEALYQLDAWDLTPNKSDVACGTDPVIQYETFTWLPNVENQHSNRSDFWRTIDLVVSREIKRGDTTIDLYLPVVLNAHKIHTEIVDKPVPGVEPMPLNETQLVVVITATQTVTLTRAAVSSINDSDHVRSILPEHRPSTLSPSQREPFYLPVDGWQGQVVEFAIETQSEAEGQPITEVFYLFVPEQGFVEAVVDDQK